MGDLTARATYSSHDGKFTDYVQEFDGTNTQLAGKRFEMSANQLWSLGLTCAPEMGLNATANANFTGDRYMNKRNTALAPSFTSYDAGVGYRMKGWEVRVDGRNLTDERDAVAESEFGDSQFYRMPARTFTLRLIMKY
jgi:outer membrane receptor protein involved in Fe transport